ncbi:MAG: YcaQ family DNA glycosylase [Betaproteobacteria bacterium]|nr:YcaQ family DNA glycosylase [Betaproteobacteria bacterium]
MATTLAQIRRLAASHSLFETDDLAHAVARLGYVQADPIRAPARAQDLILRQRVGGYRSDDLERRYAELPVFEGMFHNYGFFPAGHRPLVYPSIPALQRQTFRWQVFLDGHVALRRKVLRYLSEQGEVHPRDLEQALGAGARENGWGGSSSATTLMLDALHRAGKARVARREAGIRIYAPVIERHATLPPARRADDSIRLLVNLYAPLPQRTLRTLLAVVARSSAVDHGRRVEALLAKGELASLRVDGETWILPPALLAAEAAVEDRVRLLAPFDPVVWDRRRFEHLWGWAYRFEAYTPPAKRKLGYYALPLLWRDQVIGWANATVADGRLDVQCGYVNKKPREAAFRVSLDAEIEQMRQFLASD